MKKLKFTLVEMMVVIAVIGILVSLLLPTLGKARERSRDAVCVSNQKQLALGLFMYAEDNDKYVPATSTWRELIFPYLNAERQDDPVYNCPLSKIEHVTWTEQGIGYNKRMGQLVNDRANAHNDVIVKTVMVSNPSETIFLADTNDNFTQNHSLWKRLVLPSEEPQRVHTVSDRHRNGLNVQWVDGHVNWNAKNYIFVGNGSPSEDYYYIVNKN